MKRLTAISVAVTLAGCCGGGPPVEEISSINADAIAGAPPVEAAPSDWPWWRGPTLDNKVQESGDTKLPLSFSHTENVLWSTALPGRGHASPIIAGDQIFIATADDSTSTQSLLSLSRADGSLQWTTIVHNGKLPHMHENNSHASGTPACDGERVITTFAVDDAVWASAVSLEGDILWQTEVGPFKSKHGYGASPCIYRSAVIVAGDHHGTGYIAAVDRESGEILWRKPRRTGASFATGVIAHLAGQDQLLLSGQQRVVSYDPATGEEIWTCDGSATSTANTIAWNNTHVFVTGGWPQTGILCVRGDGQGDVTDTHIEWEVSGMKVYVPSPLVAGDVLVAARDDGIVVGLDVATGEDYWKKRLQRGVGISASPTLVGELVYLPNEEGEVFVFYPGKDFNHVATCAMGEPIFASPVYAEGRLYLRTLSKLYCIGTQ